MSNVLKSVDSRTNLVGQNRLEILTFTLNGRQRFAINVFKVKEVVTLPKLTIMPSQHPVVVGAVYLRGCAFPVFDLSAAIGLRPVKQDKDSTIIVTEYNSSIQAFLVGKVDRITNLNWESILSPPNGAGRNHYLTAITHLDDEIVEIIDVEKVLSEVVPADTEIDPSVLDSGLIEQARGREVLMVDDSGTAIAQVKATFGHLGLEVHEAHDGLSGLTLLKKWADEGINVSEKLLMVVTDAEMPAMDGYRLTTEIREDPRLRDLFVVLHTSLSGSFNEAMVKKVGCDAFLSKFKPNELALLAQERIRTKLGEEPEG